MKDGCYVSITSKDERTTEENFYALCEKLPGINLVNGLPGNELLIRVVAGYQPSYSLNQVREALVRKARVDMFELATDPVSGEQYRTWYYLPAKRSGRKKKAAA